jgi:hypothetical protein
MSTCAAIKRDGGRCSAVLSPGETYCYNHDPARAEERRRNASKAGKRGGSGRPSTVSGELARLQRVFEEIADDVLEGRLDKANAAVAIQALNGARGCVVGVLKAREQEELVREVEELKAYIQQEGKRWRA